MHQNHLARIEPLEARIAPAFTAIFDVAGLDGGNGFRLSGEAAENFAGRSVSGAGDVNGDGLDDLIVGADSAGVEAEGASYVVFGTTGGFPANLDLSTLDGIIGFKISGSAPTDYSGSSVSGAGDINGDGVDDLIVGAPEADPNGTDSGAAYVIFGRNTAVDGNFSAEVNLSSLGGTNGFRISGIATDDATGFSVSGAGDVNGDGFADVLIGAYGAGPNGTSSGAAYVLFGRNTALSGDFPASVELSTLDGSNGFQISGAAEFDGFGVAVNAAGDINGDGFDDIIIGAPGAAVNGPYTGAAYVIFGRNAQSSGNFPAQLELSSLDGIIGFQISGVAAGDEAGVAVNAAGDVNGDGFDDLIIGAYQADRNGVDSGASYVVFGKDTGVSGSFPANLLLATLDGTNGFEISGAAAGHMSGSAVSGAGDVNGDGIDDLLVGAVGADSNGEYSGATFIVFGRGGGLRGDFPATVDLANLRAIDGIVINGSEALTALGISVSAVGDLNGDGMCDLIIGATGADANGVDSGAAYVLFGYQFVPDGVEIKAGGNRATFTDMDGDHVTVKTNKGALSADSFVFGPDGELQELNLLGVPGLSGAKISLSAKSAGGGDGKIDVGVINGLGMSLKSLKVPGDIGVLNLGEGVPGKMALKSLKADSIGLGVSAEAGASGFSAGFASGASLSPESTITGNIGVMKIKNDVRGVVNVTGGLPTVGFSSTAETVIKKVVIKGNIDGSAGGGAAGLLRVSGGIGNIVVKGDVIGGADLSGVVVGGKLGTVKVGGDVRSDDATRPVTISARGNPDATNAKQAVALKKMTVGGNVLNAEVLAGYRRDGMPITSDASIGRVTVDGDWTAASIVAGVEDVTGDGFGRNDALISGDTTPDLVSRIASIVINGAVSGSSGATDDHFGITAQEIGKVVAGGVRMPRVDGPINELLDGVNDDFRAVTVD